MQGGPPVARGPPERCRREGRPPDYFTATPVAVEEVMPMMVPNRA